MLPPSPCVIVTRTEPVYNPDNGLITGITDLIVKVLLVVSLSDIPPSVAYADIVDVLLAVNGPLYVSAPPPLIEYITVAPLVPVPIVIVTDPVYVPDAGVIVGARTFTVNRLVAVSPSIMSLLTAYAIIVPFAVCVKGPEY